MPVIVLREDRQPDGSVRALLSQDGVRFVFVLDALGAGLPDRLAAYQVAADRQVAEQARLHRIVDYTPGSVV